MLTEKHLEAIAARYVKNGDVVALGTGEYAEKFLKRLALAIEEKNLEIKFIPSSFRMAEIASSLGLKIASINEHEIDVALEFVDLIDADFNFIKRNSHSLVLDKMIAQSAANLIAVCNEKGFVRKLSGTIPFEISTFGHLRTVHQLESFGKAKLKKKENGIFKTDSNNYVVDVEFSGIHNLHDLEHASKNIPGVLETGLFLGYADTVMIAGKEKITVKSRLTNK